MGSTEARVSFGVRERSSAGEPSTLALGVSFAGDTVGDSSAGDAVGAGSEVEGVTGDADTVASGIVVTFVETVAGSLPSLPEHAESKIQAIRVAPTPAERTRFLTD